MCTALLVLKFTLPPHTSPFSVIIFVDGCNLRPFPEDLCTIQPSLSHLMGRGAHVEPLWTRP